MPLQEDDVKLIMLLVGLPLGIAVVVLILVSMVSVGPTSITEGDSNQYDTQNFAQINREKLEAGIKAGDIQGILEAMAKAAGGLMNPKEEELQYKLGQQNIAKINLEKLEAAIKAGDREGILAAMKLAADGVLGDYEGGQEQKAREALSKLPIEPPTPSQTTKPSTTTIPP